MDLTFKDNQGNDITRTLSHVKDVVELLKKICGIRGIRRERLVISADKGGGKLIVTCTVYDQDQNGLFRGPKPGGKNRILVLAMVDGVEESTENIAVILEQLGKYLGLLSWSAKCLF